MFLLQQFTHRMIMRYHPRIGHLYVPNLKARLPNETGGYMLVTNREGFRSDFDFAQKKGSLPRVLMFGDSYTAGDNCGNEERFSDQLQGLLNAEVFNYGLSGSGTDQHLLIYREIARDIEADLIIINVQIDSIRRIQSTHRPSVDRVSGRRVQVPRPYFRLEREEVVLHGVPVPRERPDVSDVPAEVNGADSGGMKETILQWYRRAPALAGLRRKLRKDLRRFKSEAFRMSGVQPYPDFNAPDTPGWKLMEAILRRFIDEAAPLPVLIVPVPTYEFYLHGLEPVYQRFFETLRDPVRGVHVLDISRPLIALPWAERQRLSFVTGGHFTPWAHEKVARMIADCVEEKKLLPARAPAPLAPVKGSARRPLYVLGISCMYHNSAAALIRDGKIIAAAEEERFTRLKNDRRFPAQAANYCLEEGGIHPAALRAVVYYDNASLTFERLMHAQIAAAPGGAENWDRFLPSWLWYKLHLPRLIRSHLNFDGPLLQEFHHRSHAASAFYPSPFSRAAILTIDGVGEWATASIGAGRGREVHLLEEMHFPNSLGLLYSAFTQFTGFKVNSGEYKMMGLAPYGTPKYTRQILDHLVSLKADGSLELNLEYFGFLHGSSTTNEKFAELFGGPARKPESWITQREMDLAASIQAVTEESILKMARHAHQVTGESRLCLAGGVALNCVANGRLLREGPFEDIWIQPAAGDAGCALGAALDVYHTYLEQEREIGDRPAQGGSCWGPAFSAEEIEAYLETHGYPYRKLAGEDRSTCLAQHLADGKVVGHFSGRLEFGPRALGARSILADARSESMQADLNLKIKYRESFRPFAPSVLAHRAADYFELDRESPYMLLVAPVRQERRKAGTVIEGEDMLAMVRQVRSDIPAVTHVDFSARIQTVLRPDHPEYFDLIQKFERLTGCAVIVNTSFNVRGEPIVCTPFDAYRCFMRTEMNVLALGDYILLKEEQPRWQEGTAEGLESEDVVRDARAGDGPLEAALRNIFNREFLPIAAKLKSSGAIKIGAAGANSTWLPHCRPAQMSQYFEIPAELDQPDPDVARFVRSLTHSWQKSAVTEELRPLLIRLIQLGLTHPPEHAPETEIPESVYVMF